MGNQIIIAKIDNTQTRANLLRMLGLLGVRTDGVDFSEDIVDNLDASRAYFFDKNGYILGHCIAHPSVWTEDSGRNHGKGVRRSFRSRSSPSVQLCIREIRGGQYDYRVEGDLDKSNPFASPAGVIKHVGELYETRGDRTTNPSEIASLIDKWENNQDA